MVKVKASPTFNHSTIWEYFDVKFDINELLPYGVLGEFES